MILPMAIVLVLLLGIYIGLVLPYYATKFVSDRQRKKEISALLPTSVDDYRLCTDRHEWIESIGVDDDNGQYVPLQICSKCGFLPSKNLMASPEGLKRVIENNKMRAFEESVQRDFVNKENADIRRLLEEEEPKNSLTEGKIGEIYKAGQTCNKRYIIYKIARSEEVRREQKDST